MTKASSALTATWFLTSRTTRSNTLTGEVAAIADGLAVLPVCLSSGAVAERIAGRSFQLSRCFASSLISLSRAFSASSSIEEPIKENSLYMRRQIWGGGKVIGRPLYNRQATHRHTRGVSTD